MFRFNLNNKSSEIDSSERLRKPLSSRHPIMNCASSDSSSSRLCIGNCCNRNSCKLNSLSRATVLYFSSLLGLWLLVLSQPLSVSSFFSFSLLVSSNAGLLSSSSSMRFSKDIRGICNKFINCICCGLRLRPISCFSLCFCID